VRPDLSDQMHRPELNGLAANAGTQTSEATGEKEQAFVLNSIGGSTFRLLAESWSVRRRQSGVLPATWLLCEHQTESFKCKDVAEMLG